MEHVLSHGVVFTSKSMYLCTVICWNDYAKLGMLRRRGRRAHCKQFSIYILPNKI
jgi:hypothetical protein